MTVIYSGAASEAILDADTSNHQSIAHHIDALSKVGLAVLEPNDSEVDLDHHFGIEFFANHARENVVEVNTVDGGA